jgi:hypothetical protein
LTSSPSSGRHAFGGSTGGRSSAGRGDAAGTAAGAGATAGIDASLHVVGRLLGEQAAKDRARYMEYQWEPEPEAKPGKH